MSYVVEFELSGLPRMMNSGKGQSRNWRAAFKAKRAWLTKTYAAAYYRRPEAPLERARVVFTRFSAVRPDSDGLAAGFKAIQDGLVKAKIIVNDRFVNIGHPVYRWEKAPEKQGKVSVRVEELPLDFVHVDQPAELDKATAQAAAATATEEKECQECKKFARFLEKNHRPVGLLRRRRQRAKGKGGAPRGSRGREERDRGIGNGYGLDLFGRDGRGAARRNDRAPERQAMSQLQHVSIEWDLLGFAILAGVLVMASGWGLGRALLAASREMETEVKVEDWQ